MQFYGSSCIRIFVVNDSWFKIEQTRNRKLRRYEYMMTRNTTFTQTVEHRSYELTCEEIRLFFLFCSKTKDRQDERIRHADRQALIYREENEKLKAEVYFPPLKLCMDNAAMIGAAAIRKYLRKEFADYNLNAFSTKGIKKI